MPKASSPRPVPISATAATRPITPRLGPHPDAAVRELLRCRELLRDAGARDYALDPASSRLDREFGRKRWGDEGYAQEELVAELGAAFLCADLGLDLEAREDHAAYIAHWLKVLKNDKRAIFTAAAHAQRAVDYLHGLQPSAEEAAE